jgi:hypothetical protein
MKDVRTYDIIIMVSENDFPITEPAWIRTRLAASTSERTSVSRAASVGKEAKRMAIALDKAIEEKR